MAKREDPVTKEFINFERPSKMTVVEFKQLPEKYNWNSDIKHSMKIIK